MYRERERERESAREGERERGGGFLEVSLDVCFPLLMTPSAHDSWFSCYGVFVCLSFRVSCFWSVGRPVFVRGSARSMMKWSQTIDGGDDHEDDDADDDADDNDNGGGGGCGGGGSDHGKDDHDDNDNDDDDDDDGDDTAVVVITRRTRTAKRRSRRKRIMEHVHDADDDCWASGESTV